jgi:hypothetical protein
MSEIASKNQNRSESSSLQNNMGLESAAAVATVENIITSEGNNRSGSWLDTTTAKVSGALFAIAATLVTARDAISRAFFKTVNKGEMGAFADLQITRDKEYNAISEAARSTKPWGQGEPVIDAPKRMAAVSREYDKALKERKKILGFNNVWDEAKVLKKHQWLEVAFATGAVASVAVGAIMAIASSRSKVAELKNHIDQQDSKQR